MSSDGAKTIHTLVLKALQRAIESRHDPILNVLHVSMPVPNKVMVIWDGDSRWGGMGMGLVMVMVMVVVMVMVLTVMAMVMMTATDFNFGSFQEITDNNAIGCETTNLFHEGCEHALASSRCSAHGWKSHYRYGIWDMGYGIW